MVDLLKALYFVFYNTKYNAFFYFKGNLATINRDIFTLSGIAPIYTKQGNGGGIYILPEYRSYKNYLTDAEEDFLYTLMPLVSNEEKRILCSIIIKFTENPTLVVQKKSSKIV